MSLFLVNRYLGDEEDGLVSSEYRSRALLTRLQQKAKEKRQQQETKIDEDGGKEPQGHIKRKAEDSCEVHSQEKKKRKKDGKEKKKAENLPVEAAPDPVVSFRAEEEDSGIREDSANNLEKSPADSGFTVLGGFESKPVQKVHRILPQWLAEPNIIHRDMKSNLVPVCDVPGLCPGLRKVLQKNQVQHFFPVQAEVIPAILKGAQQGVLFGRGGYKPQDICVSAPTGSGKTLSFVIPVIQILMERVVCEVRALAVLPTKELAQQVYRVFMSYAEGTSLRVAILSGQKSFAAEQAVLTEKRGGARRSAADIVVATPGRLVDHINKNSSFCLEHLRFLIIDEADRMIDSMHQAWLGQVVKAVYRPENRPGTIFRRAEPTCITAASLSPPQVPLQKLLFSATLTQNPEKLQQLGLHQPRLFSSIHSPSSSSPAGETHKQERYDFPQGLTEYYVPCTLSKKPLFILHFILHLKLRPILCFTNSKETAHRLFLLVQLFGGVQVAEFSSRLSPGERKKALKDFEQGTIQLLISTDAAARGIDINGVKCVVNYDTPQYIRTYIHRIGRTARAGKVGMAFTFLLGVQEKRFLQMVEEAGSPGIQKQFIKPKSLQSMEQRYEETLQRLADVIKNERGTK
ncbi:unnamed protein product [Ophioblennius macclurei]